MSGVFARRILPTIWVHMWIAWSVSFHASNSSEGHASTFIRASLSKLFTLDDRSHQAVRSPYSRGSDESSQTSANVAGRRVSKRREHLALEIGLLRDADRSPHLRDARRRHAQSAHPEPDQRERRLGVSRHFAADRQLDARSFRGLDRESHELEERGMK